MAHLASLLAKRPKPCGTTKNKLCRYCRKVQGISDAKALTLIDGLQPYKRLPSGDPLDDSLWIIHDFDRIDKHRELVLVLFTLHPDNFSQFMFEATVLNQKAKRAGDPSPTIGKAMQMYGKISPGISFRQFGKWENQPVIPALMQLADFTKDVVRMFSKL
jgi:hypothetical protein